MQRAACRVVRPDSLSSCQSGRTRDDAAGTSRGELSIIVLRACATVIRGSSVAIRGIHREAAPVLRQPTAI